MSSKSSKNFPRLFASAKNHKSDRNIYHDLGLLWNCPQNRSVLMFNQSVQDFGWFCDFILRPKMLVFVLFFFVLFFLEENYFEIAIAYNCFARESKRAWTERAMWWRHPNLWTIFLKNNKHLQIYPAESAWFCIHLCRRSKRGKDCFKTNCLSN